MIKIVKMLMISTLLISSFCCQRDLRNGETEEAISDNGDVIKDREYDSEFPSKPVSKYLTDISKSVHLVSILAFYQSYYFTPESNVTQEMLLKIDLETAASEKLVFEQPASGTASLVYLYDNRVAFLTCAHIVDFPDTVINFYRDSQNNETDKVESYIYKVRQTNNVINQPIAYDFKILAIDKFNDIALIGKQYEDGTRYRLQSEMDKITRPDLFVLDIPLGSAKQLTLGTFVYLLGFPQGRKMVSTAIVSSPDYDSNNSFILDATLQKGISGGLVLALRDGVPNFEFVGITRAISGKTGYSVAPNRKEHFSEWDLHQPYDGKIYLEKRDLSEPGMTFAVGIETIVDFMEKNEEVLISEGYVPDFFFKRGNF